MLSGTTVLPILLQSAVVIASPLTVALALWRLRVGLAAAAVVLACGLTTPEPTLWLAIPAGLWCLAAGRDGRWHRIAAVIAGLLGCMAVLLLRHGSSAETAVGLLEAASVCGILIGLTVCHFEEVRRSTRVELEELHTQQGRIASEERAGVARELHDVVGHQLSLVSLQALAAEQESDPLVLRDLIHRVDEALTAGEQEISGLVGALHTTSGEVTDTRPTLSPTSVATELSRQLEGHDYHAHFGIDPDVDDLDPTTRGTVARIMQESGTNVLRHAPTGSECTFVATVVGGQVTFLARSSLPASPKGRDLSGGYGLRGIRERVELIGGTFFAGSREGAWEVRVCLGPQLVQSPERDGRSQGDVVPVGEG